MELGGQADCRIAVVTAHILLRKNGCYLRADGPGDARLQNGLSLWRDGRVKTQPPQHIAGANKRRGARLVAVSEFRWLAEPCRWNQPDTHDSINENKDSTVRHLPTPCPQRTTARALDRSARSNCRHKGHKRPDD